MMGSFVDPVLGFLQGPGHCSPPGLWPTYPWTSGCHVGSPERQCPRGSSSPLSLQLCPLRRNSCPRTLSPRPLVAEAGLHPHCSDQQVPGAGLLDKTCKDRSAQATPGLTLPTKSNSQLTLGKYGILGARNKENPLSNIRASSNNILTKEVPCVCVIESKTLP
jgi:hypothetical protein